MKIAPNGGLHEYAVIQDDAGWINSTFKYCQGGVATGFLEYKGAFQHGAHNNLMCHRYAYLPVHHIF